MSADRELEEGMLELLCRIKPMKRNKKPVKMTRNELRRALIPLVFALQTGADFRISQETKDIGYDARAKPRHIKAVHKVLARLLKKGELNGVGTGRRGS